MQDSSGQLILGLIILLFALGSLSILIDSFLTKPKDISLRNLEPENLDTQSTVNFDD